MVKQKKTSPIGTRRSIRFSHLLWIAMAATFLLGSLILGYKILFGHDYREQALKDAQRLEFSLAYDDGNATPHELEGETLTMEMAEALIATKKGVDASIPAPVVSKETALTTPHAETAADAEPVETALPVQAPEALVPPTPPTEEAPSPTAEAQPAPVQPQPDTATTPNIQPPLSKVEKLTEDGVLPTIAQDGTKPWQFNRVPSSAPAGHPRIAIVVVGLGLSKDASDLALTLPKEVSVSVSPYAKDAAQWVSQAKEAGREVLLDLPVESLRYPQVDMGPLGLAKAYGDEENARRLRRILSKGRGIVGVISAEPDALSQTRAVATPFVEALSDFGLLFVSGYSRQPEGLFRITRQYGLPVVYSDIRLDDNLAETTIRNQLARAEDLAHNRGYAVVVTHSYPLIIELMGNWIRGLTGKGYVLVPVSALAGS